MRYANRVLQASTMAVVALFFLTMGTGGQSAQATQSARTVEQKPVIMATTEEAEAAPIKRGRGRPPRR